jgi:hypothetical protein
MRYTGMDKIMETLQILYTSHYYCGVGPLLAFSAAAVRLGMGSYKFRTEFYTIILEEHLQAASEILDAGLCTAL